MEYIKHDHSTAPHLKHSNVGYTVRKAGSGYFIAGSS